MLEILDRIGDVGSVELKMNVPSEQRMALRQLKVDALKGNLREVVFFDTPDLALYKNGVVLRGRRTQGRDDDSVVKLRPCLPSDLPKEVRNSSNLKVEMDITSASHVVSASLKGGRSAGTLTEVLAGRTDLARFFSK